MDTGAIFSFVERMLNPEDAMQDVTEVDWQARIRVLGGADQSDLRWNVKALVDERGAKGTWQAHMLFAEIAHARGRHAQCNRDMLQAWHPYNDPNNPEKAPIVKQIQTRYAHRVSAFSFCFEGHMLSAMNPDATLFRRQVNLYRRAAGLGSKVAVIKLFEISRERDSAHIPGLAEEALAGIQRLAEAKDSEALYQLGLKYINTSEMNKLGVTYLRQAGAHAEALQRLASDLRHKRQYAEACTCYRAFFLASKSERLGLCSLLARLYEARKIVWQEGKSYHEEAVRCYYGYDKELKPLDPVKTLRLHAVDYDGQRPDHQILMGVLAQDRFKDLLTEEERLKLAMDWGRDGVVVEGICGAHEELELAGDWLLMAIRSIERQALERALKHKEQWLLGRLRRCIPETTNAWVIDRAGQFEALYEHHAGEAAGDVSAWGAAMPGIKRVKPFFDKVNAAADELKLSTGLSAAAEKARLGMVTVYWRFKTGQAAGAAQETGTPMVLEGLEPQGKRRRGGD